MGGRTAPAEIHARRGQRWKQTVVQGKMGLVLQEMDFSCPSSRLRAPADTELSVDVV